MPARLLLKPGLVGLVLMTGLALGVTVHEAAGGRPGIGGARGEVAGARALSGRDFHIIDGDTVSLRGERIRIANIDTPETGDRAGCQSERRLAQRATAEARSQFRSARDVRVRRSGRDRYGRTLARIELDGRDFGRVMIAQGVAQPWRGQQHEWCA